MKKYLFLLSFICSTCLFGANLLVNSGFEDGMTVEEAKKADVLFDQLMGVGVAARKKFIQDHSKEAKYGV